MEDSEQNNEQLDRYFRNEMSEEERKEFLIKIENDEELKRQFDQHKDLVKAIQFSSLGNLKDQLKEKEKEYTPTPKKSFIYLKMAAGICLLAISTWFIVEFSKTSSSPNKLYADNYEPYPNIVNPLNRSSDAISKDPYALFELGEYNEALSILKTYNQTDTVLFYTGQVHLALNQNTPAIESFEKIQTSSMFADATMWYKALAYLAEGKATEAKEVLSSISKGESAYSQRAKSILTDL